MAIRSFRLTLLAVAFSATNALALDLPLYDVEGVCHALTVKSTDINGNPATDAVRNQSYKLCIRDEQASYDLLNLIWRDLSDATQKRCASYLGAGNSAYRGYSRVESCASAMVEHDRLATQPQKFRY